MADTAEDRLNVRLEATMGQLQQTMQRALGLTRSAMTGMQGSADQMRANMQRNAAAAAQALTSAQQRIGAATGVISDNFRSAASSADAFSEVLDMRDGVNRLQASMDPLHAATMRYQAAVAQVEAAVERGAIEQAQANTVLRLAKAQYDATALSAQRMGAAQAGATTGMSRLFNVSSAGRFVLQNTAAQIGDVAVQLQMGTAMSRVMAQQLPQLLGGFGALGGALGVIAPLLGTIAAVGIPVAAMLYALGNDADDSAESVETFADKLEDAISALGRARDAAQIAASGGLDQLRERYGQVTTAVLELSHALADIERRAALSSIRIALEDQDFASGLRQQIEDALGTVGGAIAGAFDSEVESMRQGVRDLQAEIDSITASGMAAPPAMLRDLSAMQEELAAVEGRMGDIGSLASEIRFDPALLQEIAQLQTDLADAVAAGDMSAIADTARQLREALQATGQEIDQNVLDNLTRVEDMARQAVAALELGEGAANGLGGAIGGAADQASVLTANLRQAASALSGITSAVASLGISNIGDRARVAALESGQSQIRANAAAQLAEERARLSSALGSSEGAVRAAAQQQLDAFTSALNEQVTLAERLDEFSGRSSGGGGGGGRPSVSESNFGQAEIEALQQRIDLIGRTDAEVATLEARYRLLNEARRLGLDLDAEQAGTGETVRQEIERQADAIGRLTEEYQTAQERAEFFGKAQSNLKDGILDAIVNGESLAGVLEDLARSFARAALEAALFNSGPFAGGSGGGLLGGLMGALGFGRASGGTVQAGSVHMVGENGPEPFFAPVNGRILSNGEAKRALAGSPAAAGGENVSVQVLNYSGQPTREERSTGPDGRKMVRIIVAEDMARGKFDGPMGRYGSRPQGLRR